MIRNAKATAINEASGETVKLKKKDAHALGLLCYVESELNEYADNYCDVYLHEGAGLYNRIYGEIAKEVCGVMLQKLSSIINDTSGAMISNAKDKQRG